MTRYFFLFLFALTAAAAAIYAYLGGFKTPAVALETSAAPLFVAGQSYSGPAESDDFGPLFRRASETQKSGQVKGDLANIYYNSPEKACDTVRAFVGIAVADTLHPLPAGWRYRTVPAGQRAVVARLHGTSFLLAPGKLYTAALRQVEAQKLKSRNVFVERFGADDASEVRVGVE